MIRKLEAPFGGMVDAFLKRALEMRYALGRAAEPHLLAKVVAALTTYSAGTTGNANLKGYAVADAEFGGAGGADGDDDS